MTTTATGIGETKGIHEVTEGAECEASCKASCKEAPERAGAGESSGARVDACRATRGGAGIVFNTFHGARDVSGQPRRAASWAHFVGGLRRVLAAEAPSKGELPAIGPFVLRPGERRADAAVEAVTLLALDVDDLPAAELPTLLEKLAPLAAAAHSSPSDGGPGAPKRKLRVYALPSRPIAPSECRRTRSGLASLLGVNIDRAALNPSRIFYVGRLSGTAERECWAFDGDPVDVDALLESAPADDSSAGATPAAHGPPLSAPPDAEELASRCPLGRWLLARGYVLGVRVLARGPAVRIVCPNGHRHRELGRTGSDDRTAVYLPPRAAGSVGAIACHRTACSTIGDGWLSFADDDELRAVGVRVVRVRDVYTYHDATERVRIGVRLVDTEDLRERYFRASQGTVACDALFRAAHLRDDDDPVRLRGAFVGAVLDDEGNVSRIVTIEPPPPAALLGAAE